MRIITQTQRLFLRELELNDAVHFLNINADPETIKYTGDVAFKNLEEAKTFLTKYLEQYDKFKMGRWAVCLKSTDQMIGWCGLKYHRENNLIDLGYRFYKGYWNKGYATEAASASINYGFSALNLNKIVAHVHQDNISSHNVVLKIGMEFVKAIMYDNQPAKFYHIEKVNK